MDDFNFDGPVRTLPAEGFSKAPGVREVADRVIERFPESFDHLHQWQVDYWFDGSDVRRTGQCTTIGKAIRVPDMWHAITLLDGLVVVKSLWWMNAKPNQREALVYHELCHFATVEGDEEKGTEDRLVIVKHEVEAFIGEALYFGDWRPEFAQIAEQLRLFTKQVAA